MSTVDGVTKCEQCGGAAKTYFDNKGYMRHEVFCPLCGYKEWSFLLIDRKKQKADPEHQEWFLKTKDGKLIRRTYVRRTKI